MTETELFGMFRGSRVTLLGAGVSNMPLCDLLVRAGAKLTVRDRAEIPALGDRADRILSLGAELVTGDGYLDGIEADWIFRSPGFRPDLPALRAAVERGARLTSEMELFLEKSPAQVIGVTGSDGKSTTTTLVSLLLRRQFEKTCPERQVFLGGNIGEPLLHRIPRMRPGDMVAAELSSFQLMTVRSPVRTAVITNITPNHLNWHTDMEEYAGAKAKILNGCGRAVLNYGNDRTFALGMAHSGPVTWFSREPIPETGIRPGDEAICLRNGTIDRFRNGRWEEVLPLKEILLPGLHNAENYMAAIAATEEFVTEETAAEVARTFGGVAHRLELVRERGGVRYYNSSIDSSPTRTLAALSALQDRNVVLILGGYDKHIPFEPLAEGIVRRGHFRRLVITGATADSISDALDRCPGFRESGIEKEIVRGFDEAFAAAAAAAVPGDCVLLSPACASFDLFPNFEVRGEHFRQLVRRLP